MDRYIEMLLKIKENVHIERLLNEFPEWIGFWIITVLFIGGVSAAILTVMASLDWDSTVFIVIEFLSGAITLIAGASGIILLMVSLVVGRQVTTLTDESQSSVIEYVSQMSKTEYDDLKQQVELHWGSTFEDSDLEAINDLLIEKMLPRRNNIIFFRTGAIVSE